MAGDISVPVQSEQRTDRTRQSKIGGPEVLAVANTVGRHCIPVPPWNGMTNIAGPETEMTDGWDGAEYVASAAGYLGGCGVCNKGTHKMAYKPVRFGQGFRVHRPKTS